MKRQLKKNRTERASHAGFLYIYLYILNVLYEYITVLASQLTSQPASQPAQFPTTFKFTHITGRVRPRNLFFWKLTPGPLGG